MSGPAEPPCQAASVESSCCSIGGNALLRVVDCAVLELGQYDKLYIITPGVLFGGWPVRIVPENSDFSIARLVQLHLELRASLEVWVSLLMNHRSDVDEESLVWPAADDTAFYFQQDETSTLHTCKTADEHCKMWFHLCDPRRTIAASLQLAKTKRTHRRTHHPTNYLAKSCTPFSHGTHSRSAS